MSVFSTLCVRYINNPKVCVSPGRFPILIPSVSTAPVLKTDHSELRRWTGSDFYALPKEEAEEEGCESVITPAPPLLTHSDTQ